MGGGPLPPPPPPPPLPRACAGTTKQGLPCRITWQLDALGFCKYHTQLTRACRGVARSTGARCRIRWDLDAQGFCKYHTSQAPDVATTQCVAIARSTQQRCRNTTGVDARGLCSVHRLYEPTSQPQCRGTVFHTGQPCVNDAKPGYDYCCAAHDPSLPYFSPRLFDAPDKPRSLLEPQIVRQYDGRDLYHNDHLDLVTPGAVELDHILEKQCFAWSFYGIPFHDVANDAVFLAGIVRDECANELANVCLTRTATNKLKGAAVWKYLDDTLTGHAGRPTFTDYLLAEQRDAARLERATTRVITREMGRALKTCQYKLADQGETPLLDALSRRLQDMYVRMELHSATPVTKLDASSKPTNTTTSESRVETKVMPKCVEGSGASKLTAAVHAKPFVPGQGGATGSKGEASLNTSVRKSSSLGSERTTNVSLKSASEEEISPTKKTARNVHETETKQSTDADTSAHAQSKTTTTTENNSLDTRARESGEATNKVEAVEHVDEVVRDLIDLVSTAAEETNAAVDVAEPQTAQDVAHQVATS